LLAHDFASKTNSPALASVVNVATGIPTWRVGLP
jgi:hypothetical protein